MAVKRSYPTSEVRGNGREYQTATAQERPRGATPRPRSGGAAERRYPAYKVRGSDERRYPPAEARGRSYPTPPRPRPRAAAGRTNPKSKEPWLSGTGGLEELSQVEGQEGRGEKRPLVQGKEHWLRFAGAAVKTYPTPKVRETQVRR